MSNKIESLITEYWNDTELFLDTENGNDANDGLSIKAAKKTLAALITLTKSRIINSTLVFRIHSKEINQIDLSGIKTLSKAQLIITNFHDSLTFVISDANNNQLIKNTPIGLKIKLVEVYFLANQPISIKNIDDLTIEFCEFYSNDNYEGDLLELSNLKKSTITGNIFYGDSESYTSSNLLSIDNNDNCNLGLNDFYYSTKDTIKSKDSSVTIARRLNINEDFLGLNKPVFRLKNSLLTINDGDNITIHNVAMTDSNIINNIDNRSSGKTYYQHFSSLSNEEIIQSIKINTTASIKSLKVQDDNDTTSYDLKINNLTLNKVYNQPKIKIYNPSDINNKLSKDSWNDFKLIVSEPTSNIYIALTFIPS